MVIRAMITGETHPPSPLGIGSPLLRWRMLGLAAVLLLARTGGAAAFPFLDATDNDQVPQGTELTGPEAQDLQHQLQLANGFGAPAGGGWTIVPQISWQEMLTDNVFEAHSPRQWDIGTFISPGINIAGDLPRVTLTFSFAPTLSMYARTTELNALTYQMNGLASVTLVPDLAFVDIRALAGVQSEFGGIGGLGTVGAPAGAAATTQVGGIGAVTTSAQGLNKDNEVQTTSFGVSPYLLRNFGDWGTGKIGYSVNVSASDAVSGFVASPFPSGGMNATTMVSNEEIANFTTGDFLQFFQDNFSVDLQQSQGTAGAGVINGQTGVPLQAAQNLSSTREIISDQITYVVNRSLSLLASGGHEDIAYSGTGAQKIDDLTWSLGATWAPNPDSSLTISYGHQNGSNSWTANGHYALTARTSLTVSYGSTLGTQLQQLQNQLNLETNNANGTPVSAQNGGQLYGATNALAVEEGVFKTTTLAVGSATSLDRDTFSINLLMATQTSSGGGGNGTSEQSKIANLSWMHQMRPDMTVSAAISYAIQDQTVGVISAANPGNNTSIAASLAWQWQISDTLTGSVRYSLIERQSPVVAYDMFQNMLILGISKNF
jgi:hypothetical protein